MTVGLQNLSNQNFYNVRSLVPPVCEQERIVTHSETSAARHDFVIRAAHREIELLREYRTRLIADVVTGKLDVREAAARFPDEVDEIEEVMLDEDDDVNGEEAADVE